MYYVYVVLALVSLVPLLYRPAWLDVRFESKRVVIRYFLNLFSANEFQVDANSKVYKTTDFLWQFRDRYRFQEYRIKNLVNRSASASFLIPVVDDAYDYILVSPNRAEDWMKMSNLENAEYLDNEISDALVLVMRFSGLISFVIGLVAFLVSVAIVAFKSPWLWAFIEDEGVDLPLSVVAIPLFLAYFVYDLELGFCF